MDTALALSLLLSTAIGLSLGIFGGGGSVLAVPMLVLVTHLAPGAAVGTSLAMVGTTSLIASYAHHRRGYVIPKVALQFGLSGVVTAFLGARLTALVSAATLLHAFALLMVLVGIGMLFGKSKSHQGQRPRLVAETRLTTSILAGAGVGLVTGFLGVGGGFLVVPALVAFAGLEMRRAVGTSLLVIAINSAAGFAGHIGGGQLDFHLIALLTVAAVVGALAGEQAARHVSSTKLRRGFGLLVIGVGITVTIVSAYQPRTKTTATKAVASTRTPRAFRALAKTAQPGRPSTRGLVSMRA